MDKVIYSPIGLVHTPYDCPKGIKVKKLSKRDTIGKVELFSEYVEGLCDISGFSHIILICHLHLIEGFKLKTIPYMDKVLRGIFSTRSPSRPNSIGLSTVELLDVSDNYLIVRGVDLVDRTPLLDIKPFVTKVDWVKEPSLGWLEGLI